jgi:hypothetical protein
MKDLTRQNLIAARSSFRRCAEKLEQRRSHGKPLPASDREMQIGFGLCADWQRWAAGLDKLRFATKSEKRSSRAEGLIESTRFNYMWTGANALFSRDSILSLAKQPLPKLDSELHRFEVLYDFAQVPTALVAAEHKLLNQLLNMECKAEPISGAPKKSHYKMLEMIFYKYTVANQQKTRVGKMIKDALNAAPSPALDVPVIIYAARNWNVHGVLISSSFRGTRKKYVKFVESIMLVLSNVLARAAINFDAHL